MLNGKIPHQNTPNVLGIVVEKKPPPLRFFLGNSAHFFMFGCA